MPAPRRPRPLEREDEERPVRAERLDPRVPAVAAVFIATVPVGGADTGAAPQVSQYPSTTVPAQPGSAHGGATLGFDVAVP
ncbi:hypothetical protein [Nocardia bovistercoris]|uniref:hypothetical protein n=1 Tax=Nocardia bovistercoris TaxID=2785916 RepID=UPI001E5AB566|nr:hypothetical protein [Nocardia bovistercoris]